MLRRAIIPIVLIVLASVIGVTTFGCGKELRQISPTPIGAIYLTDQSVTRKLFVYPEDYVIGQLLQESNQFATYYEDAMANIKQYVDWVHDPYLPTGIAAANLRDSKNRPYVLLRVIPASSEDGALIAHELEGLVLDAEGFRRADSRRPEFSPMSSALNSMVYTPLRDSRLESYGFDFWETYRTEMEVIKELLSQFTEPTDEVMRWTWIFNCVQEALTWEDVLDNPASESEFQQWFSQRYPDVAEDANEVLALVREIGYDTPTKQIELFQEIIENYELDDKISF